MLILRRVSFENLPDRRGSAIDEAALASATEIIDDIRHRGETAVREHAARLGDLPDMDAPLLIKSDALRAAADVIHPQQRDVLARTAARIEAFARSQMDGLCEGSIATPGGQSGWRVMPVRAAGCYAPGGRYPLPSSVLMTAITARVAGVPRVIVASPKPSPITLAAASIAGADAVLTVGGAQGIASLALGLGGMPACDVIAGPGNAYVTAAKFLLSDRVRIDMLAGPSELLIIADDTADPYVVAADLLAQAEHDVDAIPMLIVFEDTTLDSVNHAIESQLATLPTAAIARESLTRNGFALCAATRQQAAHWANDIAPEHLQLSLRDAEELAKSISNAGAVFVGERSAEAFGDYGFGPNHVLPTGGTARNTAGLSVMNFVKFPAWLRVDDARNAAEAINDAIALARLEGLEAHARAAERRLQT